MITYAKTHQKCGTIDTKLGMQKKNDRKEETRVTFMRFQGIT